MVTLILVTRGTKKFSFYLDTETYQYDGYNEYKLNKLAKSLGAEIEYKYLMGNEKDSRVRCIDNLHEAIMYIERRLGGVPLNDKTPGYTKAVDIKERYLKSSNDKITYLTERYDNKFDIVFDKIQLLKEDNNRLSYKLQRKTNVFVYTYLITIIIVLWLIFKLFKLVLY